MCVCVVSKSNGCVSGGSKSTEAKGGRVGGRGEGLNFFFQVLILFRLDAGKPSCQPYPDLTCRTRRVYDPPPKPYPDPDFHEKNLRHPRPVETKKKNTAPHLHLLHEESLEVGELEDRGGAVTGCKKTPGKAQCEQSPAGVNIPFCPSPTCAVGYASPTPPLHPPTPT